MSTTAELADYSPDLLETAPPPVEEPEHVGGGVLNASVWTMGGYAVGQAVRLGSNVVLAWLLSPAAFGVMLVVNVLVRGLNMFSDLGINVSIIRSERGDEPAFYNTAWTVQAIRGGLLWLCACTMAWPAARFYEMPQLLWLIPVVGFTAVISGFDSTAVFTLQRRLKLRELTQLELAAQVIGTASMIGWAVVRPSVVALAFGAIMGELSRMILSHFILKDIHNRFRWERRAVDSLIHFGKWIFLSTLLFFCAEQVDRLTLPKLITASELGVYGVAFAIGSLPIALSTRLSISVLGPYLAQVYRRDAQQLQYGVAATRSILTPTAILLLLGVVLEAPSFFALLYPVEFHAAGQIAQWLCCWAWVTILNQTLTGALLAVGDSRSLAVHNLATLIATAVLSVVGYLAAGIEGFIVGMAAGAAVGYVVIQGFLHRYGMGTVRQDLGYSLLLALLAAVSLAAAGPFSPGALGPDQWVRISLLVGVGLWSLLRLRGLAQLR